MKRRQRGVALVEFALILPLLLLLTFIATEFGRAMYQYNSLAKSVRDSARYLSMQTPGTKMTEARNLVVYGKTDPADTDTPVALGLTLAHVPDPTWQNAGTNPVINTVTISITGYTFNSLFPTVFGQTFGSFTFATISATMRSHL